MTRDINSVISEKVSPEYIENVKSVYVELCELLGFGNDKSDDDVEYIEEMIAKRTEAKKAKNFAEADAIRNELLEKGIILEDTRQGVKWKRA
jgi:cysteinyl-tRNA synthetase